MPIQTDLKEERLSEFLNNYKTDVCKREHSQLVKFQISTHKVFNQGLDFRLHEQSLDRPFSVFEPFEFLLQIGKRFSLFVCLLSPTRLCVGFFPDRGNKKKTNAVRSGFVENEDVRFVRKIVFFCRIALHDSFERPKAAESV